MAEYKLDTRILDQLIRDNPAKLSAFVRAVATDINSDIQQHFGTSVSPVGDPPGVDTGALRASMHVRNVGQFSAYVEDGVEYGIVHEVGLNGYPRPYVAPAFERARQHFPDMARKFGVLNP